MNDWAHAQCFIGKVQYLTPTKLLRFANTVFENGLSPVALAETLLVKRLAFKHEREVRLLYFEKENRAGKDLFSYGVDPHKLIDQIVIDPRLSIVEANKVRDEINKTTGFAGPIKRSLLYAPPRKMIFPIGP